MTVPDFLLLARDVVAARTPKGGSAPAVPDDDMIAALRRAERDLR